MTFFCSFQYFIVRCWSFRHSNVSQDIFPSYSSLAYLFIMRLFNSSSDLEAGNSRMSTNGEILTKKTLENTCPRSSEDHKSSSTISIGGGRQAGHKYIYFLGKTGHTSREVRSEIAKHARGISSASASSHDTNDVSRHHSTLHGKTA